MGPKKGNDKPSKKNQKKALENSLEERTFGMKNKNKSSKVQSFIEKATKSVKNSALYADGEKAKKAKKDLAAAKQLEEENLRVLFNDALSNQHGKSKAEKEADAKKLGIDVQRQEVQDILDSLELDDSDYDTDDEPEQVAVTNDNNEEVLVEAVEVFREKTIEDIIEEQRQQLAANGVPGTPVNSETFAAWRAKKLAQKQADAEARLKAEQTKKKGGKGLSVLSGKELFNYNATLFTDDNSAITATEEQTLTQETRTVKETAEDAQVKLEREKAMRAQEELQEIYRLEEEARKHKLALWTEKCTNNALAIEKSNRRPESPDSVSNPFVFTFNNVNVNGYVFAIDEVEMLEEFEDDDQIVGKVI